MIPTISYAITTHNETAELLSLINLLNEYIADDDEIVVLDDHSTESTTLEILESLECVHKRKLNKDYAAQKNYLNSRCIKDYIFQIDADELPTKTLLFNLKAILAENTNVDLFWVPRENTVHGIEQHHIRKWRWHLDAKNRINYPDYQGRIYKNKKELKWERPVHEYISGHTSSTKLPMNSDMELIHPKTIDKQVKNNNLYNTNYTTDGRSIKQQ